MFHPKFKLSLKFLIYENACFLNNNLHIFSIACDDIKNNVHQQNIWKHYERKRVCISVCMYKKFFILPPFFIVFGLRSLNTVLYFILFFFIKITSLIVFQICEDYSHKLILWARSSQYEITITNGLDWHPYQQFPAQKTRTQLWVGKNDLLEFLVQKLNYIGK